MQLTALQKKVLGHLLARVYTLATLPLLEICGETMEDIAQQTDFAKCYQLYIVRVKNKYTK